MKSLNQSSFTYKFSISRALLLKTSELRLKKKKKKFRLVDFMLQHLPVWNSSQNG